MEINIEELKERVVVLKENVDKRNVKIGEINQALSQLKSEVLQISGQVQALQEIIDSSEKPEEDPEE